MTTNPEEFDKFLHLLPVTPYLIPIAQNSKHPDVPEGESWKDPRYQLTPEQARKRLTQNLNVGVAATGQDLLIFDLDNPKKYTFEKETLTVMTRSGKLHKYFLNDGTVKNADGKGQYAGCGEVRAAWKYVVAAGSFVPSDKEAGDGIYHVIVERQPVTLNTEELPKEFQPTPIVTPIQPLVMDGSFRNCHGWSLEDLRERDEKLDGLLKNINNGYASASEADMATLSKLLYWGYSENEATTILRHFRDREKLMRDDYIKITLTKIGNRDTITDHVNVRYWTPKQGANMKQAERDEAEEKMAEILTSLNAKFTFKTPTDIEEIYYYNEGLYEIAEQKIKNLIETWLGTQTNTHFVEEVLNHIRRASYVDRQEFNKSSTLIPVQNGLLNLSTLTLEPFDKDKIFTYKLNVTYDPEKKSLIFQDFLKEILDSQDIPTLQEYMGYCLVPAMPYHKMMWFYGTGRNGKGRITATLQNILDPKNCANLNLEEFSGDRRFSAAQLYGKMINVSSEPATSKTLQTPMLKKVTGEDYIDAEVKNKQRPIKFINFAKLFILGNRYPKVNDNTIAFWDRVLLIKFPNSFIGTKQIVDIERAWVKNPEEMSGILNWMLEGLARLLSNNEFTVSKTTQENMLEFKRISDTTIAFLDEQCEFEKDGKYTRSDLYDLYKTYCDKYGLIIDEERIFVNKLKQNPKIKSKYQRIEHKMTRVWIGLKVKTLPPDDLTDTLDTLDTLLTIPVTTENKIVKEVEVKESIACVSSVTSVSEKKSKLSVSSVSDGSSILESNGEGERYKQQNQTAYISHIKTAEPCYNNCGLASEWQVKIEPDFQKCFCNGCFDKAKRDLEKSGWKVEFKEVEK